jgi:hypothetical protein
MKRSLNGTQIASRNSPDSAWYLLFGPRDPFTGWPAWIRRVLPSQRERAFINIFLYPNKQKPKLMAADEVIHLEKISDQRGRTVYLAYKKVLAPSGRYEAFIGYHRQNQGDFENSYAAILRSLKIRG